MVISDVKETKIQRKTHFTLRYINTIGILSAISAIVMLFEIPLWFAPEFYKLDASEIVVLVGTFCLGPVAGIIIELLKNLLNLLLNGTTTAGVGEFANFLIGCSFVVPVGIIYEKLKNFKGALIGAVVGTIVMAIVGGFMNYYILLPMYSYFYKAPIDAFVAAGTEVNKYIVDVKTLVMFATVPFNLVKGILTSIITLLLYNKLKPIIHS